MKSNKKPLLFDEVNGNQTTNRNNCRACCSSSKSSELITISLHGLPKDITIREFLNIEKEYPTVLKFTYPSEIKSKPNFAENLIDNL